MDWNVLLPLRAMFTTLAAIVFSLYSKAVTEKKRKDPDAPKSLMAQDGPVLRPLR